MVEDVISQIKFEIAQIDQLLETYADLLDKSLKGKPDLVEIAALGSVLHSFYNGLENIFLSVAKGLDESVPAGSQWHRDLLTRMTETRMNRGPLLTTELTERLSSYLGFRHFFRHTYSFVLEWDEMEKLVAPLMDVWKETREALQQFLEGLPPERNGL